MLIVVYTIGDTFAKFSPNQISWLVNYIVIAANIISYGFIKGGFELTNTVMRVIDIINFIAGWLAAKVVNQGTVRFCPLNNVPLQNVAGAISRALAVAGTVFVGTFRSINHGVGSSDNLTLKVCKK